MEPAFNPYIVAIVVLTTIIVILVAFLIRLHRKVKRLEEERVAIANRYFILGFWSVAALADPENWRRYVEIASNRYAPPEAPYVSFKEFAYLIWDHLHATSYDRGLKPPSHNREIFSSLPRLPVVEGGIFKV